VAGARGGATRTRAHTFPSAPGGRDARARPPQHRPAPPALSIRLPAPRAGTRIPPVPTLPLFTPPDARPAEGGASSSSSASPDAGHRVIAPGGYEWWHFEADDPAGRVRVVATLYDGCPFHPGYLRAHARYLRRPTRVAPAVPAQYPCADVAVYADDRPVARRVTQYPPGSFQASGERPEVRVGPHALHPEAGGGLRLNLPTTADLSFRAIPPSAAGERRVVSRELAGADHYWVLSSAGYQVEGTVVLPSGSAGGGTREVAFRGRGYHDHQYGTGPFGPRLRRWVRGYAFVRGDLRVFHVAQPRDPRLSDEGYLGTTAGGALRDVRVGAPTIREDPEQAGWGLSCPGELAWAGEGGRGELVLRDARVIDATPFSLRARYDVKDRDGPGAGQAYCEIIYPGRLRTPVVGRLIERSIRRDDATPA
jgi:carotenoid 1,2-hydratase